MGLRYEEAHANMLHGALQNTKKNHICATTFISKMKGFAFELATAGKKIHDDEMKSYLLNGLDCDYNSLVASINAVPRTTLIDMCL
jgi:hypothetical protein